MYIHVYTYVYIYTYVQYPGLRTCIMLYVPYIRMYMLDYAWAGLVFYVEYCLCVSLQVNLWSLRAVPRLSLQRKSCECAFYSLYVRMFLSRSTCSDYDASINCFSSLRLLVP